MLKSIHFPYGSTNHRHSGGTTSFNSSKLFSDRCSWMKAIVTTMIYFDCVRLPIDSPGDSGISNIYTISMRLWIQFDFVSFLLDNGVLFTLAGQIVLFDLIFDVELFLSFGISFAILSLSINAISSAFGRQFFFALVALSINLFIYFQWIDGHLHILLKPKDAIDE